jgi:hypothetical protein
MKNTRFTNRHFSITVAVRRTSVKIVLYFTRESEVLSLLHNNKHNLKKAVEELQDTAADAYFHNTDINNFQLVKSAAIRAENIQPIYSLIRNAVTDNTTTILEIEESKRKENENMKLIGYQFCCLNGRPLSG